MPHIVGCLMDNENLCTPRRPRPSTGWMEQRS